MTTPTALVVLNPVAGPGDDHTSLRRAIEDHLTQHGWHYNIHETAEDEDVTARVTQALENDYTAVIAAGGDGTVSAVAGALVSRDTPLLILTAGTGNALARELDIPLDLEAALGLLTSGEGLTLGEGPQRTRAVDAFRVADTHHFLNLRIGASAAAMADTSRPQKQRLGLLAYLLVGAQKLIGLQPARFRLTVDGRTQTVRAADIIVANSGTVALSALQLAPDVTPDDGRLAVCVIRARTGLAYLGALVAALLGRDRSRGIDCQHATRTISIEAKGDLPVQADGDPLGCRQVTAHVVRVIVPPATTDDGP